MRFSIAFSGLSQMVRKMGATPIQWISGAGKLDNLDIAEILLAGIEIPLEEVEVNDDGLLSYQGEQVLLYIMDTNKDEATLLHEPENAPRFHVADCRTLDTMRSAQRFDRYVVTNNTSGEFRVEFKDWATGEHGETTSHLKACKNCLNHLNYKGYKRTNGLGKSVIWNDFSIAEFFETYKSRFKQKPSYTDTTAPTGGYAKDWNEISTQFRQSIGWKCQECKADFSERGNHNLLHVHHVNGVKGDNSRHNLRGLCLLCHGEQPQHSHMHIKAGDRSKILALRREQKSNSVPRPDGTAPPPNTESITVKGPVPKKQSRGSLSREEVRKELIQFRTKIWAETPKVQHSKGILRKTMLNHFLEDRISSEEEFRRLIPNHEIQKTSEGQFQYLSQIFSIVKSME